MSATSESSPFCKQERYFIHGRGALSSKPSTLSAVSHSMAVLYTIAYSDLKENLLIAEQHNRQTAYYDDQQLCQIVM